MGNHEENASLSLEELAGQIRDLKAETAQLAARLNALEKGLPAQQQPLPGRPAAAQPVKAAAGPAPLIDTSALLPRIATICFLLVVALILRTITDNQIINVQVGSYIGMAYAAVLIILGWRLYGKGSRLAPVFPGCGILLLFSIVLETHAHYESISTLGAYALLFIAGSGIFALSIRHRASVLISLGVPGTAAVAMAIDFPYPVFPVMGALLLAAIVASSYAFKHQMSKYLRWAVLLISAIFWLLWSSKINTLPTCAEPIAEAMYPTWFFPMVFAFWGVYLATVVLNVLKRDLQLGFFESIIPTITAAGAFGAGYAALCCWFGNEGLFYAAMVVIATMHLGLAWWLARRDKEKAAGANVFILAGATLIVLSSLAVVKTIGYVLPIWSASALGLVILSAYLHNEGVRITSYLLQTVTCVVAIATGAVLVPTEASAAGGFAAISLCLFSLAQYVWSRANVPVSTNSFFFSKIDQRNHSAVILLITSLLGGYYFGQFFLDRVFGSMEGDFTHHFRSGQSLIINIGALILMYIALKQRNKELIIVGSLVALIGAGKVFIFDLFGIKGVPLVLSVFSTGVVAAFGSVVMGRWQKKETETA